jgi:hypothetical protein
MLQLVVNHPKTLVDVGAQTHHAVVGTQAPKHQGGGDQQ